MDSSITSFRFKVESQQRMIKNSLASSALCPLQFASASFHSWCISLGQCDNLTVAPKEEPNHDLSITPLGRWIEVFVLVCCVCFSPNLVLCTLASSLQRTLFQMSCGLFRHSFESEMHPFSAVSLSIAGQQSVNIWFYTCVHTC